jgi:hypothetical protein
MSCMIRLNNLPDRTWYGLSSVARYCAYLIPAQWLTRCQFHCFFKLNLTLKYQLKRSVYTMLFSPRWVAILFSRNTLYEKKLSVTQSFTTCNSYPVQCPPTEKKTHQPFVTWHMYLTLCYSDLSYSPYCVRQWKTLTQINLCYQILKVQHI